MAPGQNLAGRLVFEAELRKSPGERLGINAVLVSSSGGSGLVVESVSEGGLVDAWNNRSHEPRRIQAGDFIIRVNGVEGDVAALAAELKSRKDVTLTMQRPSAEEGAQTWKDLQATILRGRHAAMASQGQPQHQQPQQQQQQQQQHQQHQQQQPQPQRRQRNLQQPHYEEEELDQNGMLGARRAVPLQPQQLGLHRHLAMAPPSHQAPQFEQGRNFRASAGPGPEGLQTRLAPSRMPATQPSTGSWEPGAGLLGAFGAQPGGGGAAAAAAAAAAWDARLGGMAAEQPEGGDANLTFEAKLDRPDGARLGIDVLPAAGEPGGLTVQRISKGGIVDGWNQLNPDAFGIRPEDRIICVNGARGDFKLMMEQLRSQQTLWITVSRQRPAEEPLGLLGACTESSSPVPPPAPPLGLCRLTPPGDAAGGQKSLTFDVELEKPPGTRLGIDVMLVTGNGMCGLVVERVPPGGCVDLWNQKSRPPHQVQARDYIVAVNGIGKWQDFTKMVKEFERDNQKIRFTVQREPPDQSQAPNQAVSDGVPEANPMLAEVGAESGACGGSQAYPCASPGAGQLGTNPLLSGLVGALLPGAGPPPPPPPPQLSTAFHAADTIALAGGFSGPGASASSRAPVAKSGSLMPQGGPKIAPQAPPQSTRFTSDAAAKQMPKAAASRRMAPKTGGSGSPAPAMPLPTGLVAGSAAPCGPKAAAPKAVPAPGAESDFVADGQRIERGRASCAPVAPIGSGRTAGALQSDCSAQVLRPPVLEVKVEAPAISSLYLSAATGTAGEPQAAAEVQGRAEESTAVTDEAKAAASQGSATGAAADIGACGAEDAALADMPPPPAEGAAADAIGTGSSGGMLVPPAKLLLRTLQLNDEELMRLLRTALRARPWLVSPVAEALSTLKDPRALGATSGNVEAVQVQ